MIRLEKRVSKVTMPKEDKELIERANSTTYRSTIKACIKEAKTKECKEKLENILRDPEMEWED